MDTILHAFFAWFLCRKKKLAWLAAVGGALPDLASIATALFLFFAGGFSASALLGEFFSTPFRGYYLVFHSFIVFAIAALVVLALKRKLWPFFFGWGLHLLIDLPTHSTDGIRPLWPLTDWQFCSPFSWWDFSHGAPIVIAVEAAALAVALWILWKERKHRRR